MSRLKNGKAEFTEVKETVEKWGKAACIANLLLQADLYMSDEASQKRRPIPFLAP
ncbi:hypothetical protein [Desulforhabdus amnigena]|jgi:hypothetical protein|uniref:Uncharacterized protein n=1 Tax=Desulforhabdus amnigena TaxID=40218 RepID=A0A9W6FVJ4_9BACT|nr:hypothetical protein [Desulforhabdus amnigena]NLJ28912.1 hypothetical protein [Deltaproteobacteria bacterium]GLI35647.1 hypothetical protein DAMNIGENAA_30800 [Desulforhabdus amnigena]